MGREGQWDMTESPGKEDPPPGQLVHGRRPGPLVPVGPDPVGAQGVDGDDEKVGLPGDSAGRPGENGQDPAEEETGHDPEPNRGNSAGIGRSYFYGTPGRVGRNSHFNEHGISIAY